MTQISRPGGSWGSQRLSVDVTLPSAAHGFAPLGDAGRRPPVKSYSYGERDYAFGQVMLTLRTNIGLTQAGLADLLGISRRSVAEWEAGSSYPKADHLKEVITLGVQQQGFPAGCEAEEIRALWKAARQKVLLDESWLAGLLSKLYPPPALMAPGPIEQTGGTDRVIAPPAGGPWVDWDDALAVPAFYGREGEVAQLTEWVLQERCRVVSVLGLGGIGKSALAVACGPSGDVLASCGDDGAMTLWDLESGEQLRTLLRDRPYERLNITGIRGLTEAQKAILRALGRLKVLLPEAPGKLHRLFFARMTGFLRGTINAKL